MLLVTAAAWLSTVDLQLLADVTLAPAPSGEHAGYDSGFAYFMGEQFQSLVGIVLVVGGAVGGFVWRSIQRRTLDNIYAKADESERKSGSDE